MHDTDKRLHLETKYNTYKGFLIPYLVAGDLLFKNGRWKWWLECITKSHISKTELPPIRFLQGCGEPGYKQVMSHLEKAIEYLSYRAGAWDGFGLLMDWLLWGFGDSTAEFPNLEEEHHMWLYKYFKLGLLQQYPFDYLGDLISERKGNGSWNPTAFYPTPMSVSIAMAKMTFCNGSDKAPFETTIDPAVGTGRLLLAASSYSLFLFGNDIDPTVIKACKINLNLYAPWGAFPVTALEEQPYYSIPESMVPVAEARLIVAQQLLNEMRQPSQGEEDIVPHMAELTNDQVSVGEQMSLVF